MLLAELEGAGGRPADLPAAGGAMTETPTYEDALRALLEADDRLVVLTAENRAAIRDLPAALGPRFIDVGICEQTMVGAWRPGLALRGRVPVVHALATFLTLRAFEFIRTRRRYRPAAGQASGGRSRLPVRGQWADPSGHRRHRGHARHSGHAGLLSR